MQRQLQEQQKQQATLFNLLQQQQHQQQQQQPQQEQEPMEETSNFLPPAPRVKYEWNPSPELISVMDMDHDLFVGPPLTDKQRSSIIDLYPPIAALDYRPPDAVPEAYGRMNDFQRSHDASLKSIQYLLSAIFRPLDILAHQLVHSNDISAVETSLKTLHDARVLLLLNASNSVNQYRNGIAIKVVNKSFKPDLSGDTRLTMPAEHFHSMISQLHSTQKSIREAQQFGKSKPFRQGPPSQHGGTKHPTTTALPITTTTTTIPTVSPISFDSTNVTLNNPAQIFPRATTPTTDRRRATSALLPRMGYGNQQLLAAQYSSTRFPYSLPSSSSSYFFSSFTNFTSRFRPTPTNRAINSRFNQATCHQGSQEFHTRFLQLNLCDSQEKQRYETRVQSEGAKPVHRSTAFQDGNVARGFTSHPTQRLSHVDRSTFGVHSYPHPSSFKEVPPVLLARQDMGIYDSTIRSQHCSVPVHQTDSPDIAMGTQARDSNQRVLGRFDLHREDVSTDSRSHEAAHQQTSIIGMDNQFREVSTTTDTTIGASGFPLGHDDHASTDSKSKDSRLEEIVEPNSPTSSADTSYDSQLNDANSGSYIRSVTSTSLHSPSIETQESNSSAPEGLGYPSATPSGMSQRDSNVDTTTTIVERSVLSASNTQGDTFGGRERYRLGLPLELADNSWILDTRGSSAVNQLEGIEGSISRDSIIQDSSHQLVDSDRQHHLTELHQQTRRNAITFTDDTGDRSVEVLPEASDSPHSSAYTWSGEQYCRQGISPTSVQESMDDTTNSVSEFATALWIPRRQSFRGQDCGG